MSPPLSPTVCRRLRKAERPHVGRSGFAKVTIFGVFNGMFHSHSEESWSLGAAPSSSLLFTSPHQMPLANHSLSTGAQPHTTSALSPPPAPTHGCCHMWDRLWVPPAPLCRHGSPSPSLPSRTASPLPPPLYFFFFFMEGMRWRSKNY